MIGVTVQSYGAWENNRNHTDASYGKVVAWINGYFVKHNVSVTVEDVTGPDLVKKIREQIELSLHGPEPDAKSYARWTLETQLFKDVGLCRVLGITEAKQQELRNLLEIVRGDLDKEDWIDLFRIREAGRWEQDGWMFTDPTIVSQRVRFKSDRKLTDAELEKVNKIVQSVVNEVQAEEKKKRSEG